MVDSCSNILSGDQFYNFLTHNFYRHFDQNRAPLGLFFHAAWLKNNPEYLDAFLYWVDEVLESHPEAYFITMTQVIQWIQNPVSVDSAKNYAPWQESALQALGQIVWYQTAASSQQMSLVESQFACTLACVVPTSTPGLTTPLETGSCNHLIIR